MWLYMAVEMECIQCTSCPTTIVFIANVFLSFTAFVFCQIFGDFYALAMQYKSVDPV